MPDFRHFKSMRSVLLAVSSGILQILIFPNPAFYYLSWIALLPLLTALLRESRSAGRCFLLAYLCGTIWYAGSCSWVYHVMNSYGGLSPPVAFGVLILFCLYLGLYHGLFGLGFALLGRSRFFGPARALALVPFLWVTVELARARITGFPWDLLGYAQIDNIPLTRIATVTGVYGISFVVALVNSVFALAIIRWKTQGKLLLASAVAAAIAFQLGVLAQPAPEISDRSALLLQENLAVENVGWSVQYFDQTIAALVQLTSSTKRAQQPDGPSLVVWPESPAPFYSVDPKFHHWIASLAQDTQSYLIVGGLGVTLAAGPQRPSQIYNSALLIAPDGEIVSRYDKIHLVPFGEYVPFKSLFVFAEKLTREVSDFSRGMDRTVFQVDGHKVAAFICYESIFPDEVRQFAAAGGELFVNISNDGWFGEYGAPSQHMNMARMRAIENHRWLLRSTNTGISGSIDPYGRVVVRAPRNVRIAVAAPYAFETGTTFYTRHGDWFAYTCAIISVVALIVAATGRGFTLCLSFLLEK